MLGHREDRVFGDGEDGRDHRKAHGDADHQRVALVKAHPQIVGDEASGIAAKEPAFEQRACRQTQIAHQQQHGDQQQRLPALRHPLLDPTRQVVPGKGGHQHRQRQGQQQQEDARQMLLNHGRQPQTSQKTEDDRRQRRHDLHRRLDDLAHARRHEVTGEDGTGQCDGHRKQHGVGGGLDGAKSQRYQAQLGFEIIRGRGGLPDVLRLRVTFVPDLLPQSGPGHLRMLILDVEELEAFATLHQQAVVARREHQGVDTTLANHLGEQTALTGGMEQIDVIIGGQRHEPLAAVLNRQLAHRTTRREFANVGELTPAIAQHLKPLRDDPVIVGHQQR